MLNCTTIHTFLTILTTPIFVIIFIALKKDTLQYLTFHTLHITYYIHTRVIYYTTFYALHCTLHITLTNIFATLHSIPYTTVYTTSYTTLLFYIAHTSVFWYSSRH